MRNAPFWAITQQAGAVKTGTIIGHKPGHEMKQISYEYNPKSNRKLKKI